MTDDSTTITLPSTAQIQSCMLRDPHLKLMPVWDSLHRPIAQLANKTMDKATVYRAINQAIVGLIHNLQGNISETAHMRQAEWLPEIAIALIRTLIDDYVVQLEAIASLSSHLAKLGFAQQRQDLVERVLIGIF